jgi:predicted transcriptional regulator
MSIQKNFTRMLHKLRMAPAQRISLAERVGMWAAIARLESGKTNHRYYTIVRIAKALGKKVEIKFV